jgi:hypothetical protein
MNEEADVKRFMISPIPSCCGKTSALIFIITEADRWVNDPSDHALMIKMRSGYSRLFDSYSTAREQAQPFRVKRLQALQAAAIPARR